MTTPTIIQTTLLHYLSLLPVIAFTHTTNQRLYTSYAAIITLSSTLSVVWHSMGEPENEWQLLDYSAAAAWSMYNIISIERVNPALVSRVVYLELLILSMNQAIDYYVKKKLISYVVWHSRWHVASAMKSLYISYLLCSV